MTLEGLNEDFRDLLMDLADMARLRKTHPPEGR
jgi:hypothetical protein